MIRIAENKTEQYNSGKQFSKGKQEKTVIYMKTIGETISEVEVYNEGKEHC